MCGLFGVINPEPRKINWTLVDVLGIANDSRGGDSCGLFIDGRVNYGIDKNSYWVDWYHTDFLHKEVKEARILLGHCRKASVGGKDSDKAHPICHYTEYGVIDFVMVHNGTIKNHTELAKRYLPDENTIGMSDTQIMAKIFYNHGYDVLLEYTGAAIFVTVDYRTGEPITRVFQGWSKENYSSKDATPERPFYFIWNKGSYVFSSIYSYLMPFIPGDRFKDPAIYTVPKNTLCILTPEGISKVQEFDRSEKVQTAYTSSYSYGYGGNPTFTGMTTTTSTTKTQSASTTKEKHDFDSKVHGISIHSIIPQTKEYLTYNALADCYYADSEVAHGCYLANFIGRIAKKDSAHIHTFYFWHGTLLFNKECFDALSAIAQIKNVSPQLLTINEPDIVHFLSPYPWRNYKDQEYDLVESSTEWTNHPYTGELSRVFDLFTRTYAGGMMVGNEHFTGYVEAYEKLVNYVSTINVSARIAKVQQRYAGSLNSGSKQTTLLPLETD